MAYNRPMPNSNRFSTYSNNSTVSRAAAQSSSQVSTQTLLNALHTAYSAGKPYSLESSTSLVVNTWISASPGPDGRPGGTVDAEIAHRAWEHARRRAEDGCIVLGSLHDSCPSLLLPFISALPVSVPATFYSALSATQPFLRCITPQNPATGRHSALAATFTFSLATGNLAGASLKLSSNGIDTAKGLTQISSEPGNRAFDVFYYLLSSASTAAERESLGLRSPSTYTLLRKSQTYDPPSYLPTGDDAAAAEEFRAALKAIGISGRTRRDLVSVLAALLKLGDTLDYLVNDDAIEELCEDAAGLLDLDPELLARFEPDDRAILIGAIYEALVDWVVSKANEAISADIANLKHNASNDSDSRAGALTPVTSDDGDTVDVHILEIPSPNLGKAISLKNVFDDSEGINAEMKEDGVQIAPAGHSVLTEMKSAIAEQQVSLGITDGPAAREHDLRRDHRDGILENIAHELEPGSFLNKVLLPIPGDGVPLGRFARFDLPTLLGSSRVWFHLSLHPTDEPPAALAASNTAWSASSPSRQLRSWRLPEWANRRNKLLDFTADFDPDEFHSRYSRLGCKEGKDGIESFILERGWSNGEVIIGNERIWIREGAWWDAENQLDMLPAEDHNAAFATMGGNYQVHHPEAGSGFYGSPFGDNMTIQDSRDDILQRNQSSATLANRNTLGARSLAPTAALTMRSVSGGDYGLGRKGDEKHGAVEYYNDLDPELGDAKVITEQQTSRGRRIWVGVVWALTFWIPSPLLRVVGRMKRPDVRMAWREKVVLVFLILLLNAIIVFYIVAFGRILCPNFDKVWNEKELSYHQGDNDFYVATYGRVYDISHFWRSGHGGQRGTPTATSDVMQPFAGLIVDPLFPLPLDTYCSGLVSTTNDANILQLGIQFNTTNANLLTGFPHKSGSAAQYTDGTNFGDAHWYDDTYLPKMKQYYKGELVWSTKDISKDGNANQHPWFIINNQVYDLTNYYYTLKSLNLNQDQGFFDETLTDMVTNNPGGDLTDSYNSWRARNASAAQTNFRCLNNVFYIGQTDFRETAKCQVNNYILLAFTIILCSVILVKFLAALQLGSKRRPAQQDKFVICQVPAYTEGEDHLRKGLDSLTALAYDNKRKLICVVCDGMIVGGGNDRPTPKIVLDILGVDPKIDPPALPFKSVGQSNEQLNYGKVYSGLYEFEGNVVPYIVVVKVGKESEQTKSKPGNRGKRDSQILLMSFLNRVHHRSPMSPLELEMFHQINNIIGVDPELYEYLFMVDADTMVKEDALTRLVASCANDSRIAGICGETSLENEEHSWWTMMQVYEYFISHHLAKAFESLFGSVTCLPGCFCMYRLRTADKGKPLIISDAMVKDYSDCDTDTLHKKNLLSLGEDRYLTTLMTKHFPHMSYKFVPDAFAQTAAPDTWSILLSQRRRWINSTIHNLAELVWLKDLCGFCCFSMRFVVFIDLFGTIILPATFTYLVYLIVFAATGKGQFPLISIIIIAAVYGLQAIIFIIKRQWQHIGWMIIYILAFPIYSFILPVYSFWKQDDFSWGNTRIVIGEKGSKQVVALEDEGFDPRSIPLQCWDDYALANNLPGRRGMPMGSEKGGYGYDDAYEMDDMRSVYSSAKPASTILTGFKSQQQFHMPPQSPAPFAHSQRPSMAQRNSTYGAYPPYTDQPSPMAYDQQSRLMSMGNASEMAFQQQQQQQQQQRMSPYGQGMYQSSENLMGRSTPQPMNRAGRRSPMPFGAASRPASTINFQQSMGGHGEPTDSMIVEAIQACLTTVDLETVTKKTLKALVEQRLHVQLSAERKAFLDRQIDAELAQM